MKEIHMTKEAFRAAQEKLRWSVDEAAVNLRVSRRAVERWRAGSRAIPGPVAAL